MIAVNINTLSDFILDEDKSSAEPTVFKIGRFDVILRAYLSKKLAIAATKQDATFVIIDIVRFGLKGWNLKGEDNQAVEFQTEMRNLAEVGSYQGMTDKALNCLEMSWINGIASKIMAINFPLSGPVFNEALFAKEQPELYSKYLLGGDAEKNSPLPSTS